MSKVPYDKYYQTENLFGEPYPELIHFFEKHPTRGKLLDLGCGQGRDAISLARMGYEVTGVDHSAVGIRQMLQIAEKEQLSITGLVADVYSFEDFSSYDFILLDSMLHFRKSELKQESELVQKIINNAKKGALIVCCIQNSGKKIATFYNIIKELDFEERTTELDFKYRFEDKKSNHASETAYKMVVFRK